MMRLLILSSIALVLSGCKPAGPAGIPVTGLVTLDGQPCAHAIVSFVPQGETKGNGGMATTDEQGRFVAHLHDGHSEQGPPGLPAGQYKVLVNKLVKPDGNPFFPTPDLAPMDANAKELLPAIYSNYQQSTLEANVAEPQVELKYDLRSKQ